MTGELVRFTEETGSGPALPPVLHGSMTPAIADRVADFYASVATIFEAWVGRRKSDHTRRAYRGDVMAFVAFMGWRWPDDAANLLRSSLLDVQAFKASIGKSRRGGEDHQPAHLVAVELLQVSGRGRGGAAAPDHGAESGACSVHLAGIRRSGGRDAGALRWSGPGN